MMDITHNTNYRAPLVFKKDTRWPIGSADPQNVRAGPNSASSQKSCEKVLAATLKRRASVTAMAKSGRSLL